MNRWTALLAAVAVTLSAPAAAQSPIGDWIGTLEVRAVKLRIVVHIAQGAEGQLTGTIDSPDQGASGIPIAGISPDADTLGFTVPSLAASYSGKWDESSGTWKGEFSQGTFKGPLDFAPGPLPEPLPANWQVPSDAGISEMIAARIAPRRGQGMVVGVLEPQGRRVIAGNPATGELFDGRTLFEIGSISKVFTALLLADMANKGEVSLDDPVEKYLPAGARMPERNGRKITLTDLSTHTSGLPRIPNNMPFGDPGDPYADYTEALMLAFLGKYELTRDPGEKWDYSNLGVGLLGYVLGRAAHSDYETLLRERITGPLGMADTVITLSPDQQARFAPGRDTFMQPAKPWRLPTLAGAGAIRSTTDDMLKLAAAVLDPASPIAAAMKTTLSVRRESGFPTFEQALGWQMSHPEPGREVVTHSGGTGGYRSTLAIEPASARATVVLANSGAEPSTPDLAMHLLIGSPVIPTPPVPPPPPPPTAHTEITLSTAELDRVVGSYDFGNGIVFDITREGDGLHAQRQGSAVGPVLPIFAEAPLKFFWRAVNGAIEFTVDAGGKVSGAEATFDGQKLTGKRLAP